MRRRLTSRLLLPIAVLAALLWQQASASAMAVEPMLLDISTAGQKAQQSFRVINNGAAPLPVEIAIARLELGLDGEQKVAPGGEEFLVYPAQAMIPKGGTQVFRVQWIGAPDIPKSRTYRFNVSQVPVKLPKDQSGIQIVMSFGVTVNVAPPEGQWDLVVTGASPMTGKDGKRVAAVTVRNPGNKHAYLRNAAVSLTGKGWSAQVSPGEIAQKVGLGIVQPGKERRFLLPVEVPSAVSSIQASVKIVPEGR